MSIRSCRNGVWMFQVAEMSVPSRLLMPVRVPYAPTWSTAVFRASSPVPESDGTPSVPGSSSVTPLVGEGSEISRAL
jgi:hypothetical protein